MLITNEYREVALASVQGEILNFLSQTSPYHGRDDWNNRKMELKRTVSLSFHLRSSLKQLWSVLDRNAGVPTGGRGYVLGLIFAGYVLLASQNPYPIIVNSVAKYRPHLSHFWEKCNFRNPNLQNNLILQKKVSGVDEVVNLEDFSRFSA